MAKELPIQIVELRQDQDDFKPEGGGGNQLPKWVTDTVVKQNGTNVCLQLNLLEDVLSQRQNTNIPILVEAKLNDEATAKSHRGGVRSMFDVARKRNVIGMTNYNKVLVKIDNTSDLREMKSRFGKYRNANIKEDEKKAIATIEGVTQYHTYIDDDIVNQEIKVRLVDYCDEGINKSLEQQFLSFCSENSLEECKLDYSKNLKLYSIKSANKQVLQKLATMDGILSIRKMPHFVITNQPEDADADLDVKVPETNAEYPVVGLLDSGVEKIDHLKNWILSDDDCPFAPEDINRRHGTLVSGVLLYGDELLGREVTGSLPCKILDCIVNTTEISVRESELIAYIKENIHKYSDIKVWNLSQGCDVPISDTQFSDFAIALDELQRENDIIICKSAGNGNPESLSRITEGADSIYSLVVGSISHEKRTDSDGNANCRSPFSLVGPGPQSLIKPDVVQYGGNTNTGIKSFSIYGNIAETSGTSFSTPRISSLAASLRFLLDDKYTPLLVKAMIVHSASYPSEMKMDAKQRLAEVGYGLPSTCMDILHNDENECTMVFDLTFTNENSYQVIDFPFPESMVNEDGYYYGDITVTLATAPILNPNESVEYCQSEVDVKLETFDSVEQVQPGAPSVAKTIRNADRLKGTNNILKPSNYNAKARNNQDDTFLKERTLVSDFFKFQPIKKYHVSLEEMTKGNKEDILTSGKRWALKMKALYRDSLMTSKGLDPSVSLEQKAILIVTIRDPQKKGIAYNECIQQLRNRNFNHSNLQLTQKLQVSNEE
jgi:hypothetical protein